MQKRKKGNIIYFGLAFMILCLTLAGIFITLSTSWEVFNRVQVAIEEGAKVRAQAVDISLKESSGIIEAFHETPALYDPTGSHDINHNDFTNIIGHYNSMKPESSTYQEARARADEGTKEAIISILDQSLRGNSAGNAILENFTKDNICIQVKPLPTTANKGTYLDFSCTTALGEKIEAKNVRVTPIDSDVNTKTIFDPDNAPNSGDEYITKVVNVVFVATAYEHNYFMEGFLSNMGKDYKANKKSWAIAYPQADSCFGEFC